MSIRKPSYQGVLNASGVLNDDQIKAIGRWYSSVLPYGISEGILDTNHKDIPLPAWAEQIEGYEAKASRYYTFGYELTVLTYVPKKTLGLGFAKIVIMNKDGLPAKFMPGIWNAMVERSAGEEYHIDSDGRIRGKFGIPDKDELDRCISNMTALIDIFKKFPKETDVAVASSLNDALCDVQRMTFEEKSIQRDINQMRQRIQELQERISQRDKELNEIYEKAADAMNLIEDRGYKVDLSKENLGIEEEVCGEMYCSSDLSLSGSDLTYSPSSAGITYIPGLYTLDDLVSDSGISSASQSYN